MLQAWGRGTGQQKEAAAPSGCDVEDPIEETPAPLQERPEPASQERGAPDRRSPLRQHKQLKRLYADEQVPPGVHDRCSLMHVSIRRLHCGTSLRATNGLPPSVSHTLLPLHCKCA